MPFPFVPIAIGVGIAALFGGGAAINYLSNDRDTAKIKSETYAHQAADLQRQVFENEVLLTEHTHEHNNLKHRCNSLEAKNEHLSGQRDLLTRRFNLFEFKSDLLADDGVVVAVARIHAKLSIIQDKCSEYVNVEIEQKVSSVQTLIWKMRTQINDIFALIDIFLQITKQYAASSEIDSLFNNIRMKINDFYFQLIEIKKLSFGIQRLLEQSANSYVMFEEKLLNDFNEKIVEFERTNREKIGTFTKTATIKINSVPVIQRNPRYKEQANPNPNEIQEFYKMFGSGF